MSVVVVVVGTLRRTPISPLRNPCLDSSSPQSSYPWCNHTLPIDERVADMLARMTLDEKIANLDTEAPEIKSLGLNGYNWWSEATHGISHVNFTETTPSATNFAFPITTAMSFNRSLWRATGAAISREARAFMNVGRAYSTYWAPVINLAREPRWGRNLESAGEDPLLSGEYAVAFVRGFERLDVEPRYLAASACCKHYVANSMEDSKVAGTHHTRYSADPNITDQDLVDSYLKPFQACVEKGRVSSLMCSYNAVNGVPTCANAWLLQTVARQSWGFDGYITSDCDAVANVVAPHHYAKTAEEAVAVTLRAGMDIDCSYFVGQHGMSAYKQGLIDDALIDARLAHLFKVRFRLQHFDPPGPLQDISIEEVCSESHASTAAEGLVQSAAMYKNDGGALPMNAAALRSVAVIGPNAKLAKAMAGYYGPAAACGGRFPAVYDAISSFLPHANVTHAPGVPDVLSANTSMVPTAAALAASTDVAVLVLGTDLTVAMENRDAVNLTFSAGQLALVEAVADAAAKPVIVLTLTAVPLDLTPLLSNKKVGAILHLGQPSIQTMGVGDLLFGRRSPAGRAIQTVYPASYQHQISIFDFNMRPGPSRWPRPDSPGPCNDPYVTPVLPSANCTLGTNPGRTYRFFTGRPVVPFGFGLSYTKWSYKLDASPETVDLSSLRQLLARSRERGATSFPRLEEDVGAAAFAVNVTNEGGVDADDVVLGFITPPGSGEHGLPLKTLFGFERVHVKAGQSVTVILYPPLTEFAPVTASGQRVALPGRYRVSFGVVEAAKHGMGYVSCDVMAYG